MLPLRETLMAHYRRRAAAAGRPPSPENLSAVGTAVSVGLLAVVLGIAVLLPNVEFIFGLTGATACALLSWVLPGCIYLQLHSPSFKGGASPCDDRPGQTDRAQPALTAVSSAGVSVLAIQDQPAGSAYPGGHPGAGSGWVKALARAVVVGGLLVTAGSTGATLRAVRVEAETVSMAKALVAGERHVSTQSRAIETAGVARVPRWSDALLSSEVSRGRTLMEQHEANQSLLFGASIRRCAGCV